jgi:hypothetical protein
MTNPDVAGIITPKATAADGASPVSAPAGRPTRTLPTERVQFQKQLNVIRAYAAVSGPTGKAVGLTEVANVTKLNASTVSLCNAFFADVGFIEKNAAGSYVPSSEVMSFLRAYQWNPDTAALKLAPLLRRTWFAQALMPKLAMGSVEEAEAIRDLADESSAGPKYRPQLELLIDYLEASGVVRRDGGLLREGSRTESLDEARNETATTASNMSPEPKETRAAAISTAFAQPTEGVVQFHVSVRVDMAEFANWKADRIASFFGGIAQVLAAKGQLESGASGS